MVSGEYWISIDMKHVAHTSYFCAKAVAQKANIILRELTGWPPEILQ